GMPLKPWRMHSSFVWLVQVWGKDISSCRTINIEAKMASEDQAAETSPDVGHKLAIWAAFGLRTKRPRLGRAIAAVKLEWMIQAVPVWDWEVETEIVETPLTIYATGRLEITSST
ncbi:TPA: hypothetical protein ACNVX4_006648, partial [Pseudomonas aeruginosa]